jgi:FixJ family two-component response regulator
MNEPPQRIVAVVDDDPRARVSVVNLLQSAGFDTVTFSSGETFLQSRQRTTISCLVADIRMPGMSGWELQRRMALERPDLKVVFITGHRDESMRAEPLRSGALRLFYKPFDDKPFLDAVTEACDKQTR